MAATLLVAASPDRASDGDWPGYGGGSDEQHYSPLSEINVGNVAGLGLQSAVDLQVQRAQTQPIAVDGIVYVAANMSVVQAIDPVAGRVLWRYDPQVGIAAGDKLRGAWGIRGLAYADGRLFVGGQDGRLIAIAAGTGKPLWSVQTTDGDRDRRSITGAPRVFGGRVIIGHGGADFGPMRGYVTCYDAATGRQLWRFYTVPGDPKDGFEDPALAMAAKTWTGERWKEGGGGTVWNAITYDREFDRLYLGTGNGSPWNWRVRNPGGGDALFLASIVALDARTGRYLWHYQENPNEAWDFNSTMDIALAELTIGGRPRKVLLHAPKNGFFYVIDRQTGKLLSAEKLGEVTWAERIDLATGRPVEPPGTRYAGNTVTVRPSPTGLHNWPPMAYDPKNRLAFVPVLRNSARLGDEGIDPATWKAADKQLASGFTTMAVQDHRPGQLLAWDPIRQKPAWSVETAGSWAGGIMATGGDLVFQGEMDGRFSAYHATTGRRLWSFQANGSTVSPPLSYTVKGVQYVSVIAAPAVHGYPGTERYGWTYDGTPRRLLTFRLGARATLPPAPPAAPPLPDPQFVADPRLVSAGAEAYRRCASCHGGAAKGFGGAPDLRRSAIVRDGAAFDAVLRDGALMAGGMPRFEELTADDREALRHFIRAAARAGVADEAVVVEQ